MFVYTIQQVVKPVVNRFDNRIERTAVRSTSCQTGLYNRFDKHGLTTVLKPAVILYTIQPFVKPVVKPVVSCIQAFTRLSNRFDNRFDDRLYRVNGALGFGQVAQLSQRDRTTHQLLRFAKLGCGIFQPPFWGLGKRRCFMCTSLEEA